MGLNHWADGYRFLQKNRRVVEYKPGDRPIFTREVEVLSQQARQRIAVLLVGPVGSGWENLLTVYAQECGIDHLRPLPPPKAAMALIHEEHLSLEPLDLIGLALRYVVERAGGHGPWGPLRPDTAPQLVEGVNRVLRETGCPYQFEAGQWAATDSDFVHTDNVKPALEALSRPGFEGALEEFSKALDEARLRPTRDAANDANKAFESTIKCIFALRQWQVPKKATASELIRLSIARGWSTPTCSTC